MCALCFCNRATLRNAVSVLMVCVLRGTARVVYSCNTRSKVVGLQGTQQLLANGFEPSLEVHQMQQKLLCNGMGLPGMQQQLGYAQVPYGQGRPGPWPGKPTTACLPHGQQAELGMASGGPASPTQFSGDLARCKICHLGRYPEVTAL